MDIQKFKGDILDIGNDFYLVRKTVVSDWKEQMENLQKDAEKLNVKKAKKKTGTVAGKEGRNEALDSEQKAHAFELRERGYSLRQIGEVLGVSHETVRQATMTQDINFEDVKKAFDEPAPSQPSQPLITSNIFGK